MEGSISRLPQTGTQIVRVEDLSKSFRGIPALRTVKFSAQAGEMIALVGASGSGKSTLLRNLNGLQVADQGQVWVLDHQVQSGEPLAPNIREIRSQIGFIFQQFTLVGRRSWCSPVMQNDQECSKA